MLKEVECKKCQCPKSNHHSDYEGHWACLTTFCSCLKYEDPPPPPKPREF